jgi:hypothetical protein
MKTKKNKLMKANRNKLMKTNKPNTINHNEVKLGNDANNTDAELRATCKAWLHYFVAIFIVQREGNANNKYFTSIFFKRSMREVLRWDRNLQMINAVK